MPMRNRRYSLGLLRYGWCESFTVFDLRVTYWEHHPAESADRARAAEDVVPLWDLSASWVRARSELGARGAAAAQAGRCGERAALGLRPAGRLRGARGGRSMGL